MAAERRITGATRRAVQMMVGGLVVAHVVGIILCAIAWLTGGRDALVTALLGFAIVLVFYAIGQAIEVVACEMEPFAGLGLTMASYGVRVVGIGIGLWALLKRPSVESHIVPEWLGGSVTGVVIAWVAGVVIVASRQRVPIYDRDDEPIIRPSK